MPLTVVQKTIRGLIAIGALFSVTILSMGFLSYRLGELDFWTRHTHHVIEALQKSLSSLQDVETGERGYLYTGVPEFLEPYEWGRASALDNIARVEFLTGDNPQEQSAVKHLRELAQEKMDQAQVDVRDRDKMDPQKLVAIQRRGKQVMDAFRVQIKIMTQTEEALLKQRVADMQLTQTAVWCATAFLSIIALVLLNWVFQITRTAIEEEKSRVTALSEEIGQRIRVEKTLKETTVNLSRSNADLQQFAYVASHDLQEPLRAITGFLTLLASKKADSLDEDAKRYINHAVEGAQRMRSLVNDLLSYARVESRAKDFVAVDLQKILERVKSDLSVQIEENGATVTANDLPSVLGDSTQLTQLLQNVIGNAIKFRSKSPPVVKISCTAEKTEYLFSIQDNGRGFDMEHADRIFIIFQRLQGREEATGTGIGLAVCKKIVERHDGRIWVESKLGEGTTFFFTLPKLKENLNS